MNLDRTLERPALYGYWVDTHTVPAWAHEAILYQVFVDRFAGLPDGAANRWLGTEEVDGFVGGSLRGVIDSLDYIAGTGATALWLSPVFVTTTSTAPAPCAPVTAVIDVEETTTTEVAGEPPRATVAPAAKPVPVIVTGVPPAVEPEAGEIEATVGGGGT